MYDKPIPTFNDIVCPLVNVDKLNVSDDSVLNLSPLFPLEPDVPLEPDAPEVPLVPEDPAGPIPPPPVPPVAIKSDKLVPDRYKFSAYTA